jgi:hypothetical protein
MVNNLLGKWYLIPSLVALAVGGILICVYSHSIVLAGISLFLIGSYGIVQGMKRDSSNKMET